jgi:Ca-activated chloride channel family protein
MTFASPLNLLWLIPAWGAITALYFLRRPRRNIEVPSTLLWRMTPQESVKRAKIQRFTPHLLYFVQMLAALLVILTAMQPELRGGLGEGAPVAFLIDNGITSSATDISGSRLAAEKAVAAKLMHDPALKDSKIITVTTAPAAVVSTVGSGSAQSAAALNSVMSTDSASDVPDAISMASSALRGLSKAHQAPEIVLISDMSWPTSQDSDVLKTSKGIPIAAYSVGASQGSSVQNAAITRLSVERSNVDPDKTLEIFTQVSATAPVRGLELILTADGQKVLTKHLDLSPNAPSSTITDIKAPSAQQELTAQITMPSGFADSVADDNTAYALLPPAGGLHILLVSGGDTALETALSIQPGVHVTEVAPYDYIRNGAAGQFDVSIFDGIAPDPTKPVTGGELIWGGADRSFTASNSAPVWQNVVDWSRSDPALRFIDLGTATLKASSWTRVGAWTPLIETEDGIDVASTDQGGIRRIWTSFDPQESGFSTNPAFPIFISNCVGWLSSSDQNSDDTAGAPIVLSRVNKGWLVGASRGGSEVDEYSDVCDLRGSACSFSRTNIAGFYFAENSNARFEIARNCSASSLILTPQQHAIGVNGSGASSSTAHGLVKNWQAVTGTAVILCIILLFAEWLLFHRPIQKPRKIAPQIR